MSVSCSFLTACVLLLLAGESLHAQESVRKDANGDPLPSGASARLGSFRFRHPDTVTALALAPDGKTVFAAGPDRVIRIWDALTGKVVRLLEGHTEEVRGLALLPDGKTLVSTGLDRTLRLWDVKEFKQTEELEAHDDCVEGLAVSGDGTLFATACRDHRIGLWVNRKHQWLTGHESGVCCVAFSPDGKTLASGSLDNTVRLWDTETGKVRTILRGHKGSVEALAFTPDGKLLAAGAVGGEVHLWNPASGKAERTLATGLTRVWSLAFTRDGATVLAGGDSVRTPSLRRESFTAWEVSSGKHRWKQLGHVPGSLTPQRSDFRTPITGTACIALTADGKQAATSGADGRLRFWNPATGAALAGSDGHDDVVSGVVFLDARTLVTSSLDGSLRWWDVKTSQVLRRVEPGPGEALVLARSSNGALLATAGKEGIVRLWDAVKGTKVRELRGSRGPTACVVFSPDSRIVAVTEPRERDVIVILWDAGNGKELRRLEGLDEQPQSLAFSPDGQTLAGVSADEPVRLWNVRTGQRLPLLADPFRGVTRLAWTPEGRSLVGGFNGSRSVVLWDMASGKMKREFDEYGSPVTGITLAPDGHSLSTAHFDHEIRLWETSTGNERRVLQGHTGRLTALAHSPDGRHLASASADQTVLVWDRLHHPKGKSGLTSERLQYYWRDLAGTDAPRAFDAVCALVSEPEQALALLRPRLGALPKLDAQHIARWIGELDARSFKAREEAMENLGRLGRQVEEPLKKAQQGKLSLEAKRRIEELLARMTGAGPSQDWKQLERAIEVLELIGSEAAQTLLEKVAAGGDFRPTHTARASLERLRQRTAPKRN